MYSVQAAAEQFLLKLGQEGAPTVPSWQIASFFNMAQSQLWRRLVYNDKEKPEIAGAPRNAFQDSLLNAELLAPFQRLRGTQYAPLETDDLGFVAKPADLGEHTLLSVFPDEKCAELPIEANFVRDIEFSRKSFDAFSGPQFPGRRVLPGNIVTATPIYTLETSGPGNQTGYRLYPRGKYMVELRYLVFPSDVAISNQVGTYFAYEQDWQAGSFVDTLADVDFQWTAAAIQEILTIALSQFALSVPDPAQYNLESIQAQKPN